MSAAAKQARPSLATWGAGLDIAGSVGLDFQPYAASATSELRVGRRPRKREQHRHDKLRKWRRFRIGSSDLLTRDCHDPPDPRPAFSPHGRCAILVADEGFADNGTSSGGGVRCDPLGGNGRPAGLSVGCQACYDCGRPNGAPRWWCNGCWVDRARRSSSVMSSARTWSLQLGIVARMKCLASATLGGKLAPFA